MIHVILSLPGALTIEIYTESDPIPPLPQLPCWLKCSHLALKLFSWTPTYLPASLSPHTILLNKEPRISSLKDNRMTLCF